MKLSHPLLPLITLSLLASSATAADNLPPRLEINLDRSHMFVPLPPKVTTVTQGPDSRIWLTIWRYDIDKPNKNKFTRENLRAAIRREFTEKMPQIPNAYPILFEPTGRVWFATSLLYDNEGNPDDAIIGYDGKNFAEHPITSNSYDTRPQDQNTAAYADGHAFFSTRKGIHIYDGKNEKWSTHEIPPPPDHGYFKHTLPYQLLTKPDGKGVTAVPCNNSHEPLQWQDGNWTKATPLILNDNDSKILNTLFRNDNITIPLWGIDRINATTNDGTIFFTKQHQHYIYNPKGKDPRTPLQPSQTLRSSGNGFLTGDGIYWFARISNDDSNNLTTTRFDGKHFQSFDKLPADLNPNNTILGHDGFLMHTNDAWFLISPRATYIDKNLEDFIAKNTPEFAKTFLGPRPVTHNQTTHIQADPNGNIWLVQNQKLKVFITDKKWLDATAADKKISLILPLGKSQKILAIDTERKSIFIISIQNKTIKIEPRNEVFAGFGFGSFYSSQGEPWIAIEPPVFYGVHGLWDSCRFTESGPVQNIGCIRPLAADTDGSIIGSYRDASRSLVLIRDNNFSGLPPGTTSSPPTFVAPGLFVQSTNLATQLISLDESTAPTLYNLNTPAQPNTITYSPLGFAAVTVYSQNPNLYFFPLKKP
ncbi:MAG: hypothetical protein FWD53_02260 [Phycisphaerales bacterium]|nr:hypothetical protein [Phycisphaerales bacterium]